MSIRQAVKRLNQFNPDQILSYWYEFYKYQFSIQPTFGDIVIPKPHGDFSRHIITLGEVTEQVAYERSNELYNCWKWTEKSLNDVLKPDRTSKGIYVGLFRARQEADEELKNLSANELGKKGVIGNTLKQRLIMELDYFLRIGRTGGHLDINNITLCSGSRDSDGNFPDVSWCGGKMWVDRCHPELSNDGLRSRQQFSFI
ncbi:hypothetical protein ACFLZ0_00885 [Patescibacteria group bacterium]